MGPLRFRVPQEKNLGDTTPVLQPEPGVVADKVSAPDAPAARSGCLARARRAIVIAIAIYLFLGIITTGVFVFLASGSVGSRALSDPQTYLICLFWPIALWQYLLILLGLG